MSCILQATGILALPGMSIERGRVFSKGVHDSKESELDLFFLNFLVSGKKLSISGSILAGLALNNQIESLPSLFSK